MKSKKFIHVLLLFVFILFISTCKQAEKKNETASVDYPELEVTTQSKAALAEYNKGLAAFDLGNQQRARKYFDKAIELDPKFAMAHIYRSWTSRSTAEFVNDAKKANELNTGLSDAEQIFIDIENSYMNNDIAKRLEVSKKLVEKYPDVARAHLNLGGIYDNQNDFENARKCYNKAIELNPDWIAGYNALGNSYIFNDPKDLDKAEEFISKTVELLPNESRTHISLGDVYRAKQDLNKALTSYKKAAEIDSTDPVAISKAGHANTFLGNFDDARANFRAAAKLSETPFGEINFEAFTHLYEGNHEKGMMWLKDQAMNYDKLGLKDDKLASAKLNSLNMCKWMALHLGDAKELKAILAVIDPMDRKNSESIGTEEAMMEYNADKNLWDARVAALEGDYSTALAKAEAAKNNLESISNPRKLEGYHFAKGLINMKQSKYADAVSDLEKSNLNGIYPKFMLAMAHEKSGNAEKADELLKEISNYNFNEIGYALVRKKVQDMLASKS